MSPAEPPKDDENVGEDTIDDFFDGFFERAFGLSGSEDQGEVTEPTAAPPAPAEPTSAAEPPSPAPGKRVPPPWARADHQAAPPAQKPRAAAEPAAPAARPEPVAPEPPKPAPTPPPKARPSPRPSPRPPAKPAPRPVAKKPAEPPPKPAPPPAAEKPAEPPPVAESPPQPEVAAASPAHPLQALKGKRPHPGKVTDSGAWSALEELKKSSEPQEAAAAGSQVEAETSRPASIRPPVVQHIEPEEYMRRAAMAMKRQDITEVRFNVDKALIDRSDDVKLLEQAAQIFLRLPSGLPEAFQYARRLVDLQPDSPDARILIGSIQFKREQFEDAARSFRFALAWAPDSDYAKKMYLEAQKQAKQSKSGKGFFSRLFS